MPPTGVSELAHEEIPQEDELEHRQGQLYPVGRALRRTFDADNHDSLGNDLTGLMLQLARIDPDAPPPARGVMPVAVAPVLAAAPPPTAPRPSWWRAALNRLLHR